MADTKQVFKMMDLCCGMGGFHEGCELAFAGHVDHIELQCLLACDIKLTARNFYRLRWPQTSCPEEGDVTQMNFTPWNFCEGVSSIDLVCAGFPCQPFSNVGAKKGLQDQRNIFEEIVRVIEQLRPRLWILENVEGVLWHGGGKKRSRDQIDQSDDSRQVGPTMSHILSHLKDRLSAWYRWDWALLDAHDFGVAQSRRRLIWVGIHSSAPADRDDFFEWLKSFDVSSKPPLSQKSQKEEEKEQKRGVVLKDIAIQVDRASFLKEHTTASSRAFAERLRKWTISQPDGWSALEGHTLRDLRGGPDNLTSWDLELKGSIDQIDRWILECLVKERRKKIHARELGVAWADGMPLPFQIIWRVLQNQVQFFDHFSTSPDAPETQLRKRLDHLVDLGYLSLSPLKDKNPVTGKWVPATPPQLGYEIPTRQLSYPIFRVLHPDHALPTLTATDAQHVWLVDRWSDTVPFLRPLHPDEMALSFGFSSESFCCLRQCSLTLSQTLDLLGNSISPPMVAQLISRLIFHH